MINSVQSKYSKLQKNYEIFYIGKFSLKPKINSLRASKNYINTENGLIELYNKFRVKSFSLERIGFDFDQAQHSMEETEYWVVFVKLQSQVQASAFGLGVDFVFSLSQQEQQQE